RIMGIVQQYAEIFKLKKIESAGSLRSGRNKRFQRHFHILNSYSPNIGSNNGRKNILDHKGSPSAVRQWNVFGLHNAHFPDSAAEGYVAVLINCGYSAQLLKGFYPRILFVHGEEGEITVYSSSHFIDQIVIGVQNCISIGQNGFGDYAFNLRQLFYGVYSF